MATRGRKPKSTAVKLAEGTFRADRDPVRAAADGKPINPFADETVASTAFEMIVGELEKMGTLGSIDMSHLVAYAEAYEVRELMMEDIRKNGTTCFDAKGNEKLRPQFRAWSDAVNKLRAIGNDLGTNANARCRIVPHQKTPKKAEDKRLGFIG